MFNTDTIKELNKPLNPEYVSQREQVGVKLSYLQAWRVIDEANRIFGHGSWKRETIYCKEVCREKKKNKYGKENWHVGYEAKVRIEVDGVIREGTGFGSGISTDLFSAYEGAGKEAETDAMKRAFMTFGHPLGLALYDKRQENVLSESEQEARAAADLQEMKRKEAEAEQLAKRISKAISDCECLDNLEKLMSHKKTLSSLSMIKKFNASELDLLNQQYENRKASLTKKEEEFKPIAEEVEKVAESAKAA